MKESKRGIKVERGIYQDTTTKEYLVLATNSVNGKRIYREKRVAGKLLDARSTLIQLEQELEKLAQLRQAAKTDKDTLRQFSQTWIKYLASQDTRPMTILTYQEKLKAHILPFWGDYVAQEITPREVIDWLSWMSDTQNHYAKKTLQAAWRVFCAMMRWTCVRSGLTSPVEHIRFNCRGKEETQKESLTVEESQALMAKLSDIVEPYRTIIALTATTGARHGEVTALRKSEILFDRGLLKVCRSQTRGIVSETTKTRRIRYVPLHPVAAAYLQDLIAAGAGADGGLLFVNSKGKPIRSKDMIDPLAKLARAAGVDKHITQQVFRRGVNDLLRQTNGSVAGEVVARAILGHTTSAMTVHYSTVSHKEARNALAALDRDVGTKGLPH